MTLYSGNDKDGVNETRYKMFGRSKNIQSYQLPPTKSALTERIKRVIYQVYLWKSALESSVEGLQPGDQGWQLKSEKLELFWSDLVSAPQGVMELVCCGCKKPCDSRRCSFVRRRRRTRRHTGIYTNVILRA